MNKHVEVWVNETAKLTKPDRIVYIDGSDAEKERLTKEALATKEITELDQKRYPDCYYHRTAINDVARVEHLTFICTMNKQDAGPTNNWMSPPDAYAKLSAIFDGSMKGRTMYVIPYLMGPANSAFSKVGVELTDSIYVVLNMRIMTRMGKIALDVLGDSAAFVKGLHSKADLNEDRRFICHFPEDNTIWSVGSGYGGNVLLGKKCFSLRIASFLGRNEGWMAEHMLILGLKDKKTGEKQYIAAAFPSACGKTNLAMLVPPAALADRYEVTTVGDDIAWMRIDDNGQLRAINPEYGFFGVAPGTNSKSNPNAVKTIKKETIFTNVVHTADNGVWWEGSDDAAPANGTDWKGNPWTPASKEKGANPNSRFTALAKNCPCIDPDWESPKGVPISAIIFGGRRAKTAPLVYESFNWQHGVFVGATMASETTAAAAGQVGVMRNDPMAMKPFCGYNVNDYFAHWLAMGKKMKNPPKIFNVNWFRQDENGAFMWPGYGENLRVLAWIAARTAGKATASETAIGNLPDASAIDTTGLSIPADMVKKLLSIDKSVWETEIASIRKFFGEIDDGRLPKELKDELEKLAARIQKI
ncbi:MAG: phosphoenolpyruvate carboxykinase (GTP) [Spirochaetes bacterium]|nr:phosphoenolpyruvate carboxykinase (GTP) [Spirochaetota bacterium]